jgi:tetratricopeptide (TPR) repeat protein
VLVGIAIYSNTLSNPFVFDDRLSVVENPSIRHLFDIRDVLSPERELPVAGRPLVNLSFAVTYALAGLAVPAYHIGNIALHIACALVLLGIVRRTLVLPTIPPRLSRAAEPLSFAIALTWLVHPLNTEAVDYVTERTEQMMSLFYLLTAYAAIRLWRSSRRLAWGTAAVASCALGMMCKESMVTAPIAIVLYDRVFLYDSFAAARRDRWRLYLGLSATWLLLAWLISSGPRLHSTGFSTGIGAWTYLLNQTVVVARYLRLALWPRSLVLNYGAPALLTPGDVWPAGALIGGLVVATLVCLVRWPKIGFPAAFVFIALAPTSSVVPIATEVGAERRMYLPLAALVALAIIAVARALGVAGPGEADAPGGSRTRSLAAASLLAAVVALLGAATLMRNTEYVSALSLARTVVERYPTSAGYHMLGAELSIAGRHEEAVRALRRALPGEPRAHYTLGIELFNQGKLDEAIDELTAFVREQPLLLEAVPAEQYIGQAFARLNRWPDAAAHYRAALAMAPANVTLRGLLAEALFAEEKFDEAATEYRTYLKYHSRDISAWTQFGIASVASGGLDDAIGAFRLVAEADPRNPDAHRNLAAALLDHQDFHEAAAEAQRVLALRASDPVAREVLAQARARIVAR